MRIDELVEQLQKLREAHGDIPIVIEGELGYFEAESADVVDTQWFIQSPRGVLIS